MQRDEMQTITLNVSGMTCDGCERSIQNALARIDGVASVEADHQRGTTTITLETPVDRKTLEGAVEDAGYDVLPDDAQQLPMA